jgi:hypothetical protein
MSWLNQNFFALIEWTSNYFIMSVLIVNNSNFEVFRNIFFKYSKYPICFWINIEFLCIIYLTNKINFYYPSHSLKQIFCLKNHFYLNNHCQQKSLFWKFQMSFTYTGHFVGPTLENIGTMYWGCWGTCLVHAPVFQTSKVVIVFLLLLWRMFGQGRQELLHILILWTWVRPDGYET